MCKIHIYNIYNLIQLLLIFSDSILWLTICHKEDAVSLDRPYKAPQETDREEPCARPFPETLLRGHVLHPWGTQNR